MSPRAREIEDRKRTRLLRSTLEQRLNAVNERIGRAKFAIKDTEDDGVDVSAYDAEAANREREEIIEALRDLEHHKYGICKDCGCRISTKRLTANPSAILCLDCKQKLEPSPMHLSERLNA